MVTANRAGAVLTIDLNSISANYRFLRNLAAPAKCGAVVKCDAYGLGLKPIAKTLAEEGCNIFFVATPDEAFELHTELKKFERKFSIYMLNGLGSHGIEVCNQYISPVLNSLKDIEIWSAYCSKTVSAHPAIVNFDTGISRLGLDKTETVKVLNDHSLLGSISIAYVMSHLACADEPEHPLNLQQNQKFKNIIDNLCGRHLSSLSNSAGLFLGKDYHFDMVRPGAAIYGIGCTSSDRKNLNPAITLKGEILQTRIIDRDSTVGYGAEGVVKKSSRIATVSLGYGDGLFRQLGNKGYGFIEGHRVPIIGRVSMDLVTINVTDLPETKCYAGKMVEFIGVHQSVDELAENAGTIAYEIITAFGNRLFRKYVGG